MLRKLLLAAVAAILISAPFALEFRPVSAASHREAPLISQDPLADNTDLYAFVSPDRPDTLTIIANYIPMQTPASGPGFWTFDPNVLYAIHIDNTGDGEADISYEFRFQTSIANVNTFLTHLGNAGTASDGTRGGDAVISSLNDPDFNVKQTYSVTVTHLGRLTPFGRYGTRRSVIASNRVVPPYNIGPGATPNYEANLGSRTVYDATGGIKVFAGPRDDPFFVDLGAVFDRLELRPLGAFGDPAGRDSLAGFNVHTIAMQIPIETLTFDNQRPSDPTAQYAVIGVYATASRPTMSVLRADGTGADLSGPMVQVSRLGNPLVNELFIPLQNRDRWNATSPVNEVNYRQTQIVAPEVPAIADLLYGTNTSGSGVLARALKPFPTANRTDLELILYKGIPVNPISGAAYTTVIGADLNRARYADLLRVNLAIPPNVAGSLPNANIPGNRRLGLLGGDAAGFPNGRRLFDDVVDIFLRAGVGGTPFTSLLFPNFAGTADPNVAPNNALTDGVDQNPENYLAVFPYVQAPTSGFDSPHVKVSR